MIYTFYSYKGGVGRSMALANIAELFYLAGFKVLMVDWDLEAPGLERFFRLNHEKILDQPGVMDLLTNYKQQMTQEWPDKEQTSRPFDGIEKYLLNVYPDAPEKGRLLLLTAGRRSGPYFSKYANTVLTFDWKEFYDKWEGERYFELLRDEFHRFADIVLIDSRTGITEIGGICTYQLADMVVMFCSPNQQSIEGTWRMAQTLTDPETKDLRGRDLKVLVIPARVETNAPEQSKAFQREFIAKFGNMTRLDSTQFPSLMIPYRPGYAFNEAIAIRDTFEAGEVGAKLMRDAFVSITKALAEEAKIDPALIFIPQHVVSPRELLTELRQKIDEHFTDDELHTLCFDLGVEYEDLPAVGKAGKARELVEVVKRAGRIPELIEACVKARPQIVWSDRRVRALIAYERRYHPSRELAEFLKSALESQEHQVRLIDVGARARKILEAEIEVSDYFLLLLSEALATSDGGNLRPMINWAHECAKRAKKPDLLLVRAGYIGALPVWLRNRLNPRQYILWQSEADNETVRTEILAAIGSGRLPDRLPLRPPPPERKRPRKDRSAADKGDSGTQSAHFLISYKRDDVSQELAQFLTDHLQAHGHTVFTHAGLLPGQDFWQTIDQQIKHSDYLIVLLSQESADSEMVQAEVKRAYDYRKQQGYPDILPVRVAYDDILPLSLEAYLSKSQYVAWRSASDNETVGNRILDAIRAGRSPQSPPPRPTTNQVTEDGAEAQVGEIVPRSTTDQVTEDGAKVQAGEIVPRPRPQFDWRRLEDPGQVVSLRNKLYVSRDADEVVKSQVTTPATLTALRAPRQTGKTSLLVRAIQHAREAKSRVAFVDLQLVESQYLESEDSFLHWLADLVVSKLQIVPDEDLVGTVWAHRPNPVQKLTQLMEHHILPNSDKPLVLAIDEVERLVAAGSSNGLGMRFQDNAQALGFQNDILGMLRSWGTSMALGEPWDRLSIVLSLDTEPYLLIRDPYQSPFNVGMRVQLDDFTLRQVQGLNEQHGSPLMGSDVQYLMGLLNGHPYLTRRALYSLVKYGWSWSQLDSEAAKDDGPFGDHLRRYYWLLHDTPDQCDALKSITKLGQCGDEDAFRRLERAGLVKGIPADARWRCELYERYFKDKLR